MSAAKPWWQRLLRWALGAVVFLIWLGPVMLALGITLGYYWDTQGLSYGWPWTFAQCSDYRLLEAPWHECWTSWRKWTEFSWVALLGDGLVLLGFAGFWWWVCWGLRGTWGRLTLLRLLVLMSLVAGALAFVRHTIDQHHRHTQIVEKLSQLTFLAHQHLAPTTPAPFSVAGYRTRWKWFWDLVPWRAPWTEKVVLAQVTLDANSPRFRQAFELVCQLETVEMVTLVGFAPKGSVPPKKSALNQQELEKLARLPRLISLELIACGLTGEQLPALAQLRCESLDLAHNPISSEDVAALVPMSSLKRLDLSFTAVNDEVVPHLLQMPQLEWVILTGTQMSQQAVDQLEQQGIFVTDD